TCRHSSRRSLLQSPVSIRRLSLPSTHDSDKTAKPPLRSADLDGKVRPISYAETPPRRHCSTPIAIDLKRGPGEGARQVAPPAPPRARAPAAPQPHPRRAQRRALAPPRLQVAVEGDHQLRRGAILHLPQRRPDRARPGVEEGAGQPLQALAPQLAPQPRLATRQ